jgi:hypothetical protein
MAVPLQAPRVDGDAAVLQTASGIRNPNPARCAGLICGRTFGAEESFGKLILIFHKNLARVNMHSGKPRR